MQIACGITEDGGRKDKEGNPIPKGKYGLHALRHAAASLFIEQGWTPKRIQTVLGHASIQMTFDLYGHLFKDADDDREEMKQVHKGHAAYVVTAPAEAEETSFAYLPKTPTA